LNTGGLFLQRIIRGRKGKAGVPYETEESRMERKGISDRDFFRGNIIFMKDTSCWYSQEKGAIMIFNVKVT
jgi:hypothetical protein